MDIKRPLVYMVVALICGEIVALLGLELVKAVVIGIVFVLLTVAIGYGLFVFGIKISIWNWVCIAIGLFMILLGFIRGYNQKQLYSDYDAIQYPVYVEQSTKNLYVCGSITNIQEKKFNYTIELKTKEGIVYIDVENVENLIPGMCIGVTGKVDAMKKADNPGVYDEYKYLRSNGVLLKIKALYEDIDILDQCNDVNIQGSLYKIRLHIREALKKICTEEEYGLLAAMLIGDKTDMDKSTKELYAMQGIAHILAISGLHISIIGVGVYKILHRKMWYLSSATISGLIMTAFLVMTGNSVSAVRAVIMFILHIAADVCGRKYDTISALSLSAVLLLVGNPCYITNTSFILSYMAMLGVTITGHVVTEFVNSKKALVRTVLFNLSLSFTTMPANACLFYRLPTYSVLLNLIVVPLMGVVLIMTIMGIVIGFIAEQAGIFLIGTAVYILRMYKLLAMCTESLPTSTVVTGVIGRWGIFAYYVCLILVLVLMKYGCNIVYTFFIRRTERLKVIVKPILYGVVAILLTVMCVIVYGEKQSQFTVCFLDVGQGDCTYIRSNDGVDYLIDGGSSDEKNIGEYKLESFLEYMDVGKLEYIFVSHCDEDHISGIVELLNRGKIAVDNLVLPTTSIEFQNENADELICLAKERGVNVIYFEKGDVLRDGEMKIYCASPSKDENYMDINEASMVLLLEYGEIFGVFTGDIGQQTENNILEDVRQHLKQASDKNKEQDTRVILKVAHHGSKFSSGEVWIDMLRPDIAIISCGEENSYGHPHQETIKKLNNIDSKIYTTFRYGAIMIKRNNISVTLTQ